MGMYPACHRCGKASNGDNIFFDKPHAWICDRCCKELFRFYPNKKINTTAEDKKQYAVLSIFRAETEFDRNFFKRILAQYEYSKTYKIY